MSEWITDRLPTVEDADCHGCVWITTIGQVVPWNWRGITEGTPWMPVTPPKPYVAPKPKHFARIDISYPDKWVVFNGLRSVADNIPTREAAERIAAIYNEVMS